MEHDKSWIDNKNKSKPNKKTKRKFKHYLRFLSLSKMKQEFKALKKNKALTMKILYTILLLLIFRIGSTITTPGIIVEKNISQDSSFLGVINMLGGGGLGTFSILALGISPFITASILMQLLQSEAFPPLYRLAKSGPKGKRKINIITRTITFALAIMQAIVIINQLSLQSGFISLYKDFDSDLYRYFVLPAILVAGSMFSLFLGEQITSKGVGNGTSLIIFTGIAVKLPNQFRYAWEDFLGKSSDTSPFIGVMNFVVYVFIFFLLLYIITIMYKAERHIPIQQMGAGLTKDANRMSRLPIKVNPAGVLPVIFPLMLLSIPQQIAQLLDEKSDGYKWIMNNMSFTAPLGMSLLIILIFVFSLGFAVITFNPSQIADNFKKQGTFIPGIRPGKETEKYLTGVATRLAAFSGVYLAAITVIKYVEELLGLGRTYTFGGTGLLILVSVAVETINQLKARGTSGKIAKAHRVGTNAPKSMKGLLW